MAMESFSGIWSLVPSYPYSSDDMNQGDEHLRGIKGAIRQSFPNISATVSVLASEINHLSGVTQNLGDALTRLETLSQSYSYHIAYGSLMLAGSTTEFSASTSLSLFTGFDLNGLTSQTTAKTASGSIAVTRAGHYGVDANLCISASTAAMVTICIYVNDTATSIQATGLIPAQGRAGIVANGIVSAGASDEVRLRLSASVAKLITVKDGQLRVRKYN